MSCYNKNNSKLINKFPRLIMIKLNAFSVSRLFMLSYEFIYSEISVTIV